MHFAPQEEGTLFFGNPNLETDVDISSSSTSYGSTIELRWWLSVKWESEKFELDQWLFFSIRCQPSKYCNAFFRFFCLSLIKINAPATSEHYHLVPSSSFSSFLRTRPGLPKLMRRLSSSSIHIIFLQHSRQFSLLLPYSNLPKPRLKQASPLHD